MELLKQLYKIYAPSGGEKKIKKFIKRWVGNNIRDAVIRKDNNDGNIYIVRGKSETYPCVVAHLDQVQRNHSEDFRAVETEDIIFGYSKSKRCTEGLGADDKNGIWIALRCLEAFDNIKVAFFVGEEIGCDGSSRCDMSWFKDCRFVVEPDRRGNSDLITDICGSICSTEFVDAINPELFGYKEEYGMMTDVLELSDRGIGISCINLSCGYYDPHTDNEYTVKEDIINCLNFVKHIITVATEVYPHKYEDKWSGYYRGGAYAGSKYYHGYKSGTYNSSYSNASKMVKPISGPTIISYADYADFEGYADQLIYLNHRHYTPEELWPYVSSDLETYGFTRDQFIEVATWLYEYYEEIHDYDDTYGLWKDSTVY